MHLLIVTGIYPSATSPASGSFVQQFVLALSRAGCECVVVAPVSIFARRHGPLPAIDEIDMDSGIRVLRPRFLSFSVRNLGFGNTAALTQAMFDRAVLASLKDLGSPPDLVYGHFLYQAGRSAVLAAQRLKIPSVVGVGEGTFWTVEPVGFWRARRHFSEATAMLAVSSVIRDGLIEQLSIPSDRIRVFPNGVDLRRFRPLNRGEMCRKHGIREDAFNISFVGTFDHLKGPARLVEAIRGLRGVSLILVGEGQVHLESDQIGFKGRVPHDTIPEILAASDLFVLPTSEEGSCNAIIEAMACGIPIVTSNGRYNDDLLDSTVAVRVDPYDIAEIRGAIIDLMVDAARRRALSEAAIERAKNFDIDVRARRVISWFTSLRETRMEAGR